MVAVEGSAYGARSLTGPACDHAAGVAS